MAHIKSGGAVKGNKDSVAKRLGVKKFGGESVVTGNIIVRQRGGTFKAGTGTKFGKDYTIFALHDGMVRFKQYHGRTFVSVEAAT